MHGPFSKNLSQYAYLRSHKRQKGAALVLFALCLLVLVGVLGLVIDSSFAYFAKARLSLAADSAVLAAADAYTQDTNPDTQEQSASNAANAYFSANNPPEFPGIHHTIGELIISSTTPGQTDLTYNAQTDGPLTFAKVLSSKNLTVAAAPVVTLQSSMKSADIVMVLDESSSITKRIWENEIVPALKENYIDKLDPLTTRVAVVPFGKPSLTTVDVPFYPNNLPGFNPDEVKDALNKYLTGGTPTYKALQLAVDQLNSLNPDDNAQKIILLFTDGEPTDAGPPPDYKILSDYARETIHQKKIAVYSIGWGPDLVGFGEEYLKCLTGDPNYPSGSSCAVGIYPDSKYCRGTDTDQLDHCLINASSGTPVSVLIH